MNKKLENLFNLPEAETEQPSAEETQIEIMELRSTLDMSKRIDAALDEVKDISETEQALDNLATKAEEAFDQLMVLGANMDDRNSGKIFEVASTMLKNAVDAKTAKLEKKLRIVELQMRKEKMDRDANKAGPNGPVVDAVMVTDRNSIIQEMMKKLKDTNSLPEDK